MFFNTLKAKEFNVKKYKIIIRRCLLCCAAFSTVIIAALLIRQGFLLLAANKLLTFPLTPQSAGCGFNFLFLYLIGG